MRKRKSTAPQAAGASDLERTSIFFDKALAANLRYWSKKTGQSQAEIVRNALRKHLKEDCQLQPERIPTVELQHSYR